MSGRRGKKSPNTGYTSNFRLHGSSQVSGDRLVGEGWCWYFAPDPKLLRSTLYGGGSAQQSRGGVVRHHKSIFGRLAIMRQNCAYYSNRLGLRVIPTPPVVQGQVIVQYRAASRSRVGRLDFRRSTKRVGFGWPLSYPTGYLFEARSPRAGLLWAGAMPNRGSDFWVLLVPMCAVCS